MQKGMDGSPGFFTSLATGGILTLTAAHPVSEQVNESPSGSQDTEASCRSSLMARIISPLK
jgi:hypothetical protein